MLDLALSTFKLYLPNLDLLLKSQSIAVPSKLPVKIYLEFVDIEVILSSWEYSKYNMPEKVDQTFTTPSADPVTT